MQQYIGYIRVSTREQGDSGLGLEAQRVALRAWAGQQGVELLLIEDVQSGKDASRPGLERARALLAAGQAAGLVVAKLDRLARSVLDFATMLKEAGEQGWALVTLDVNVDTSTPQGELVAGILMQVAQFERRLIGQRTKAALAVARDDGKVLGRPRVPVEPDLLARITYLKDAGSNPNAIARQLNDEGVTSPTGRRWHAPTISRLLQAV